MIFPLACRCTRELYILKDVYPSVGTPFRPIDFIPIIPPRFYRSLHADMQYTLAIMNRVVRGIDSLYRKIVIS